jgi:RNA-directed DNA polymerase
LWPIATNLAGLAQVSCDQVGEINAFLRGHYAYHGDDLVEGRQSMMTAELWPAHRVAGNLRCLVKVHRAVERYWRRMLRSRSWAGRCLTWGNALSHETAAEGGN